MKLKLTLAYLGTNFCGWQSQKNAKSVQETVTDAASSLYGRRVLVTGCSRTDSGVHAKNYVCTLECEGCDITELVPHDAVPKAMGARLPSDISVLSAESVSDDFHARYSVVSKTYEYVFYDSDVRSPFFAGRAYHVPPISDEMLLKMNEAAEKMCGTHDFMSFMASGSKIVDTVRTVHGAKVERRGETVVFSVSADGFLYNMVRIMAGTLLGVARGRISPSDIEKIIESKNRASAGQTLPPEGLYLLKVEY